MSYRFNILNDVVNSLRMVTSELLLLTGGKLVENSIGNIYCKVKVGNMYCLNSITQLVSILCYSLITEWKGGTITCNLLLII